MKFRIFTNAANGCKIAVNVDRVEYIEARGKKAKKTYIHLDGYERVYEQHAEDWMAPLVIEVSEDFDTVFSRLNTIAE